jgi:regulator of protease activity HflC (stomatin/prohibitin superfamily)
VLRAEGNRSARILKAEGEARAIDEVFQAVHRNDSDPKVLAYQYLQSLPQLAAGPGNTTPLTAAELGEEQFAVEFAGGRTESTLDRDPSA